MVIVQPAARPLDQRGDLLGREPAGRAAGATEPANGLTAHPARSAGHARCRNGRISTAARAVRPIPDSLSRGGRRSGIRAPRRRRGLGDQVLGLVQLRLIPTAKLRGGRLDVSHPPRIAYRLMTSVLPLGRLRAVVLVGDGPASVPASGAAITAVSTAALATTERCFARRDAIMSSSLAGRLGRMMFVTSERVGQGS